MTVELLAAGAMFAAAWLAVRERRQRRAWQAGMAALEAALCGRELIDEPDTRVPGVLAALLPPVKALHADRAALASQTQLCVLYETMFNELRHGVLVTGPDFAIQFANRAIGSLFPGTSPGSHRKLIEELRDHEIDALAHEALRLNAPCTRQLRRLTGAMQERVYVAEAAPLPGPLGLGVWIMIEDITDRVVTEQIRKDFVANASHELRTPLTMINGYIETLQDGAIDDPAFARKESRFDVIFCRNVLCNMTPAARQKTLEGLVHALSSDGFLFLGEGESTQALGGAFQAVADRPGLYARNPAFRLAA